MSYANWYAAVKTKSNALIKIIKIILYHTAGRIIFQSEKGINSNIISIDNGSELSKYTVNLAVSFVAVMSCCNVCHYANRLLQRCTPSRPSSIDEK